MTALEAGRSDYVASVFCGIFASMKLKARFACSSVALTALLGSSAASAHVRLIDPPPRLDGREGGNALKIGPCGQQQNARTTSVTDFMGGETITIVFGEYIDHSSYYRVALDVEGDDSFPQRPEQAVQQQGDDPESIHPLSDINDTGLDVYILQYYKNDQSAGFMQETSYSTEVTLPNIDCQNCTLQLIQFMYNDPEPHYYQCADITITATSSPTTNGAGGTTTDGGAVPTGSATTTGAGGGTGGDGIVPPTTTGTFGSTTGSATTGVASTTGASATTGTNGTTGGASVTSGTPTVSSSSVGSTTGTGTGTGTTGGPTGPAAPATEDDAGCSCRTAPRTSGAGWLGALLGLGLLGYRRKHWPHR